MVLYTEYVRGCNHDFIICAYSPRQGHTYNPTQLHQSGKLLSFTWYQQGKLKEPSLHWFNGKLVSAFEQEIELITSTKGLKMIKYLMTRRCFLKYQFYLELITLDNFIPLCHKFRKVPRSIDIASSKPIAFLRGQVHQRIGRQLWSFDEYYCKDRVSST